MPVNIWTREKNIWNIQGIVIYAISGMSERKGQIFEINYSYIWMLL